MEYTMKADLNPLVKEKDNLIPRKIYNQSRVILKLISMFSFFWNFLQNLLCLFLEFNKCQTHAQEKHTQIFYSGHLIDQATCKRHLSVPLTLLLLSSGHMPRTHQHLHFQLYKCTLHTPGNRLHVWDIVDVSFPSDGNTLSYSYKTNIVLPFSDREN